MSKWTLDDVTIRRARLVDYDVIVSICYDAVFDWDYLPRYYHVYLQDKRANCFVAELRKKVVSLIVSNLILQENYFKGSPCAKQRFITIAA